MQISIDEFRYANFGKYDFFFDKETIYTADPFERNDRYANFDKNAIFDGKKIFFDRERIRNATEISHKSSRNRNRECEEKSKETR